VGKKYGLNASKLLNRTEKEIEVEISEDKTYFCSELIAACYKRIDVLPNNVSASQYLPSTFGVGKKLALKEGAKLGDELLIDFHLG